VVFLFVRRKLFQATGTPWLFLSFMTDFLGRFAEVAMSILNADRLGLSFGAFDLFKGISVTVANDSKIGLIGPNGVGKTSLLLIFAGLIQPTTGAVHLARRRRLGYLRQEAVDAFAQGDNTVYAEMLTVFSSLREQQVRLHEMETQMSNGQYTEDLLQEYGDLQEAFEQAGGYEYDVRIQQTLEGLGLGKTYWDMPLNLLSGGQKTRALLARLLLEKPDLLMLDEPSNHLDIEAVEWLERTLRVWEGAVLIVSHDRYFLDNTVNTIWEMSPDGVQVYSGNYSAYLLQRQERWEYYERVFSEEKARLLKEVDFIQRNWVRASTHARAMGLLRRLSRDLAIVDHFGILALRSGKKWSEFGLSVERPLDVTEAIRKVNAIQISSSRPPEIKPRLTTDLTSGNIVLQSEDLVVGFPGHPLFSARDLELRRGECAALIGPNGSGKTTFLKILLGEVQPVKGRVMLGASLKIGYFAQAHDSLLPEQSALEALMEGRALRQEEARRHLARYLFRGDDVFKPVGALSGGERARLALAILDLGGANFLLLDEPTNHIDIPAREALQEVLDVFSGTILLVSHDRYLIDRLATQVWEINDKQLQIFKGPYREFVLRRPASTSRAAPRRMLLSPKPLARDNSKDTRRRMQSLDLIEERIRSQEAALHKLTRELHRAGELGALDQMHKLSWQAAKAQADLENLIEEWEKIAT
jgi:ATP-binding cassette, subfamily F, member 3